MSTRERGTVREWNGPRKFGFIRPATPGDDVFAHASEIKDAARQFLVVGEVVEFTLCDHVRGPRATNIRRVHGGGSRAGGEADA